MLIRLLATVILVSFASLTNAQVAFPTVFPAPVLLLDRDGLLTDTRLGQSILLQEAADRDALIQEGQEIARAFESEETQLTERRLSMSGEDFQALSDDFDARVQAVRDRQLADGFALQQESEENRKRFLELARPYIGQLMQKYSASAVLDVRSVIQFNRSMDITDELIILLDEAFMQNPYMMNEE